MLGKPEKWGLHPGQLLKLFHQWGETLIWSSPPVPGLPVTIATSLGASTEGSFYFYMFDPQNLGLSLRQIAGAAYPLESPQVSEQFQHHPSKPRPGLWAQGPS